MHSKAVRVVAVVTRNLTEMTEVATEDVVVATEDVAVMAAEDVAATTEVEKETVN
jgi:hypothetical protein